MAFGYQSFDPAGNSSSQYAVVVLLPDSLDRLIAPLRERYDPDFSIIGAHITVVFPFESNLPIEEMSRLIHHVTDSIGAFQVELSSIGDFYPESPVIYWGVKKNAAIDDLYKSLYTGLDLALPHKQFCPHVTVAREISAHRVVLVKEAVVPFLPDEMITVKAIDLISPTAGGNWISIRTFNLKRP
jgi:2'-5' RNA ligase